MLCTDDRGKRVRLIPHRQLGIMPGIPSPIPLEARARMFGKGMDMSLTRRSLVRQGIGLAAVLAWCAVWVGVSILLLPMLRLPPVVHGTLIVAGGFMAMPPFMWWLIRSHRQEVARMVASEHYCASCGYPLREIDAAPDGCTVCPECGSAWRVSSTVDIPGSTKP
ncbi:MAG: hypothetical protein KF699_06160 [Phycisphaeraceae bacterium]|nr:hypothetical protein [Phycisphaeraceae bacterium]